MSYAALPTKNPGDVLTSALWNTYLQGNADSGFMRMIADTTLGSAQASISFTSIVQTFAHLMLVAYTRGDTAAATVSTYLRLNADSGANYDYLYAEFGTVLATDPQVSAAQIRAIETCAASGPANSFSALRVVIPHYTNATNHKSLEWTGYQPTTASPSRAATGGGRWKSASAVTQVSLTPSSGNFAAGTRVTLYGMPA